MMYPQSFAYKTLCGYQYTDSVTQDVDDFLLASTRFHYRVHRPRLLDICNKNILQTAAFFF